MQLLMFSVMAAVLSAPMGHAEEKSWTEMVKPKADLRYRHEWIDQESNHDRERHRLRVRLGLNFHLDEHWELGTRVATTERRTANAKFESTSTNQTLDDARQ